MKGFVPTPSPVVDLMVEKLFRKRAPHVNDMILDPGCGRGALIDGVIRWCQKHNIPLPRIVGIDSNPRFVRQTKEKFSRFPAVTIVEQDFLSLRSNLYDYIIGNPPYVSITGLSEQERSAFRARYATARGRFDLYLLFFERALDCLKPGGRLVFITPEKFMYVETALPLRLMLQKVLLEEIHLVDEDVFGSLVTYPTITTVTNSPRPGITRIVTRDGREQDADLRGDGSSWIPFLNGGVDKTLTSHTLKDICVRISCGVATGADSVFVVKTLGSQLKRFAYPTIAGYEINPHDHGLTPRHFLLMPYRQNGNLLGEKELGDLGDYLHEPARREKLLKRTCAARKPWYSFHESPPLQEILRPKILCKDITQTPFFVIDEIGELVPRHSVYYIVPKDPSRIHEIAKYLNSQTAKSWLVAHSQRVANNYLRLQSHVLKQLPIPDELLPEKLSSAHASQAVQPSLFG